jgi:hypothetical protein
LDFYSASSLKQQATLSLFRANQSLLLTINSQEDLEYAALPAVCLVNNSKLSKGRVMVSVLASSVVDRDQAKPKYTSH